MSYIIVGAWTRSELEDLVNDKISEGYTLAGGLTTSTSLRVERDPFGSGYHIHNDKDDEYRMESYLMQAMVKESTK